MDNGNQEIERVEAKRLLPPDIQQKLDEMTGLTEEQCGQKAQEWLSWTIDGLKGMGAYVVKCELEGWKPSGELSRSPLYKLYVAIGTGQLLPEAMTASAEPALWRAMMKLSPFDQAKLLKEGLPVWYLRDDGDHERIFVPLASVETAQIAQAIDTRAGAIRNEEQQLQWSKQKELERSALAQSRHTSNIFVVGSGKLIARAAGEIRIPELLNLLAPMLSKTQLEKIAKKLAD